jgi:peptidoglycan/LPS O-acetylase OafA/YrhL
LSWLVVVVHVFWLAGYTGAIQARAGAYAVDGFIILSGFVITQLLVAKNEFYAPFPGLCRLSRNSSVSKAFYLRDLSQ